MDLFYSAVDKINSALGHITPSGMDRGELERYRMLSFPLFYGRAILSFYNQAPVQLLVSAVGTGVLLTGAFKLGYFIWSYFLRPSQLQRYCHSETGSWALVTGASDGIGRAFADELLESGFNVLLHGRNEEKLKGIQLGLRERFPKRRVEFVVADASRTDGPEDAVVEKVKALEGRLTVLVNNVGGVPTKPMLQLLSNTPKADTEYCLNINCRFPTHLTSALLPLLKENAPALILNCGSFVGTVGMPYLSPYSGTKAYILAFTQALKGEMLAEKADVEVIGAMIGNVISGTNKSISLGTITSAQCARGLLAKAGSAETLTYAHWRQALIISVLRVVPEKLLMPILTKEMGGRAEEERKGV